MDSEHSDSRSDAHQHLDSNAGKNKPSESDNSFFASFFNMDAYEKAIGDQGHVDVPEAYRTSSNRTPIRCTFDGILAMAKDVNREEMVTLKRITDQEKIEATFLATQIKKCVIWAYQNADEAIMEAFFQYLIDYKKTHTMIWSVKTDTRFMSRMDPITLDKQTKLPIGTIFGKIDELIESSYIKAPLLEPRWMAWSAEVARKFYHLSHLVLESYPNMTESQKNAAETRKTQCCDKMFVMDCMLGTQSRTGLGGILDMILSRFDAKDAEGKPVRSSEILVALGDSIKIDAFAEIFKQITDFAAKGGTQAETLQHLQKSDLWKAASSMGASQDMMGIVNKIMETGIFKEENGPSSSTAEPAAKKPTVRVPPVVKRKR